MDMLQHVTETSAENILRNWKMKIDLFHEESSHLTIQILPLVTSCFQTAVQTKQS
jgi:hypothetical protein